tara:strand:- start:64 stop:300 length:237 start_codon:yes stop_codon:yes gene_type:complete
MPDYLISITDTERKCLETQMISIKEWAENGLQNRAHHAKGEILKKLFEHCNAVGIAMAVGEDAQVNQAFELGIVSPLT